MKKHFVFDCELIGKEKPVFLICCECIETGERYSFWLHKRGHMQKFYDLLTDPNHTFIGFNSNNFDAPLICAAFEGYTAIELKAIAQAIIEENLRSWKVYRLYQIEFVEFDHIDLIETAPGVMISLKTYAGRMNYPTMIDLPFHHDKDLTPKEQKVLETYCLNDLGVTRKLFLELKEQIDLRIKLGEEHGLDLRSKSDAQVAEAILKKSLGLGKVDPIKPSRVRYTAPTFIKTKSATIQEIIELTEAEQFKINFANGSPIEAEWMADPVQIGHGIYKFGLGGLHSQHDKKLYVESTDDWLISDFDVGSYYPSIMLKCGIKPSLSAGKGQQFLDIYRDIYEERLAAKYAGHKAVADSLKITLNGTFGKLGSIYSAFYAPALLIAVTITGQLNLMCLIDELERIKGVKVYSANTDGLMVGYPAKLRDKVLKVFAGNSKRTGFSYEETPYRKVAMKDVNNYIAVPSIEQAVIIEAGTTTPYVHKMKIKGKGLYAEKGLQKNPTMQVCADAAAAYLKDGTPVEGFIAAANNMEDFVSIRGVTGGGIQYDKYVEVDDWVEVGEGHWFAQGWFDKGFYPKGIPQGEVVVEDTAMEKATVKRKSRPKPREAGVGGIPFGRVARWYMTTQSLPPISYLKSGNRVPKTEGAKVCMTLPTKLPADLDKAWYVNETKRNLGLMGVPEFKQFASDDSDDLS